MSERRQPTEVRRAELTDAALRIIAERGIAALSTRTLAAEVGLTSGALFRHFPTLEALLDSVVTRVEAVLEATYPAAELPAAERLARFVEARSAAVGERIGILRLMHSEQFRLALPADGAARLAACVRRTRAYVTACLAEGQALGAFRTDVAPEALTPIVVGTVQVLAQGQAAQPVALPVDAPTVREALKLLLAPPSAPPNRGLP
jgi:AcrR family transcriptional regulator